MMGSGKEMKEARKQPKNEGRLEETKKACNKSSKKGKAKVLRRE